MLFSQFFLKIGDAVLCRCIRDRPYRQERDAVDIANMCDAGRLHVDRQRMAVPPDPVPFFMLDEPLAGDAQSEMNRVFSLPGISLGKL